MGDVTPAAVAARDRAETAANRAEDALSDIDDGLAGKVDRSEIGTGPDQVLPSAFRVRVGEAARLTIDRFRDRPNILDYNGVDTTGNESSLLPMRRMALQVPKGGQYYLPGASGETYAIEEPITFADGRGDITICGDDTIIDGSHFPLASNNAFFTFSGTKGTPALVTTSVSQFSRIVTVEAGRGADFTAGTWAMLCTTAPHIGVPGQSGYGLYPAGEWVYIWQVVGDTIYFDNLIVDNYSLSEGTISLCPVTMAENIRFSGLEFVGPGRGSSYLNPNQVPPEVGPFDIRYALNVAIERCKFRNFAKFAGYIGRSVEVAVRDCLYIGRDLRTETNQGGSQSDRFTGCYMVSCQDMTFSGNRGYGLRRMFDAGSNGTSADLAPVGRYGLIANNLCLRSYGGLGSHAGDRFTYTGNVVAETTNGGIGLRATNSRVIGNSFYGIGSATSAAGVTKIGGVFDLDYPETARSGTFEFSNNHVDGAFSIVEVTGDFTHGVIRNNTGVNIRGTAYNIQSRRWETLEIDGGMVDLGARGTRQAVGVYQQYQAGMSVAPGIVKIKDLTIRNAWRGIVIGGGDQATPMRSLEISATFDNSEMSNIHLGRIFSGDGDGYFSEFSTYEGSCSLTTPAQGMQTGRINRATAEPTRDFEAPGDHSKVVRIVLADPNVTPPPGGTYQIKQRVRLNTVLPGLPYEWICTDPGTYNYITYPGTVALTAPRVVSLAQPYYLPFGSWILIPGAGSGGVDLKAQVMAVSSDYLTLTLDRDAATAVTGASISSARPSWAVSQVAGIGSASTLDVLSGTAAVSVEVIAPGAQGAAQDVTVPGAKVGDMVVGASHSAALGDVAWTGSVRAANSVRVWPINRGAATSTAGTGTLRTLVRVV